MGLMGVMLVFEMERSLQNSSCQLVYTRSLVEMWERLDNVLDNGGEGCEAGTEAPIFTK